MRDLNSQEENPKSRSSIREPAESQRLSKNQRLGQTSLGSPPYSIRQSRDPPQLPQKSGGVLIRAAHCYNQSDMRCLILVVFLAIAQAPSPTSQKATDSATGTAHAVAKDDNENRAPISPSQSVTNPVAINPSQSASNSLKPQDAPQSVRIRELPPRVCNEGLG